MSRKAAADMTREEVAMNSLEGIERALATLRRACLKLSSMLGNDAQDEIVSTIRNGAAEACGALKAGVAAPGSLAAKILGEHGLTGASKAKK